MCVCVGRGRGGACRELVGGNWCKIAFYSKLKWAFKSIAFLTPYATCKQSDQIHALNDVLISLLQVASLPENQMTGELYRINLKEEIKSFNITLSVFVFLMKSFSENSYTCCDRRFSCIKIFLTLWLLSALLRTLPNKVYILSKKRLRKAPYIVKWHFMFLIWSCLSYDPFQSVFRHFGLTFSQYFLAVLMITFENGVRHEWSWSNYIRSTGF